MIIVYIIQYYDNILNFTGQIFLKKYNEIVQLQNDEELSENKDKKFIEIERLKKEHSGTYICEVSNYLRKIII